MGPDNTITTSARTQACPRGTQAPPLTAGWHGVEKMPPGHWCRGSRPVPLRMNRKRNRHECLLCCWVLERQKGKQETLADPGEVRPSCLRTQAAHLLGRCRRVLGPHRAPWGSNKTGLPGPGSAVLAKHSSAASTGPETVLSLDSVVQLQEFTLRGNRR